MTDLHIAAILGDPIEDPIENGDDEKDNYGNTPLHFAARCVHIDVVDALIEKWAYVLLQNLDGKTPRDLATGKKIKQLLKTAEEKQIRHKALRSGCITGVVAGVMVGMGCYAAGA